MFGLETRPGDCENPTGAARYLLQGREGLRRLQQGELSNSFQQCREKKSNPILDFIGALILSEHLKCFFQ